MNSLVKRAMKRDKKAFTELMLKQKNSLYKIARTHMNKETDVEDVVQETMIEAFIKIHQLKNEDSFKRWIEKILINQCNEFYRKKYNNEIPVEVEKIKSMCNIENKVNETEEKIDFNLLIKNLDKIEREIILLFYNEKYKIREISEVLNMNENTVKTKLLRAKKKLKKFQKKEVM